MVVVPAATCKFIQKRYGKWYYCHVRLVAPGPNLKFLFMILSHNKKRGTENAELHFQFQAS